MIVRAMKSSDIDKILYIEQTVFSDPWSASMIADMYESDYDYIWVADKDGDIIAYINMRILSHEAELMRIAVLECYRGRGLAYKLMQEAVQLCTERNADSIFLEVRASNQPAISLYKKYNFYEIGRRKAYYSNPSDDALLMRMQVRVKEY